MRDKIIGRVAATEKNPTTTEKFTFWTDPDFQLSLFDIVKVMHIDGSFTFGAVNGISHITDSVSFMTNYIASDFGSLELEAPTLRPGMNCVESSVLFNTKNIYTPVHNDAPVYLASHDEITQALGLDRVQKPIVLGSLTMYSGTKDEITLPVNIDSDFILDHDASQINISGLADRTSFAMFIMKALQERFSDSTAFVIFNVKGRDLMAIHKPNDSLDKAERLKYKALGLSAGPFRNVKYYVPSDKSYLTPEDIAEYISSGQLMKFVYCYEADRESLEMLVAGIDDPQQILGSIIDKILDDSDPDFRDIKTWQEFMAKLNDLSQNPNEITAQGWRKFKRIINRALKNDCMFSDRIKYDRHECRLSNELKQIQANDVRVIDIAKLSKDKQIFVIGDVLKTLCNLKLGEYDNENGVNPPSKIIIFVDDSPAFLDIAEKCSSLGVILLGSGQFNAACRDILPRLNQGEFLLQSPAFRTTLRINFPRPAYKYFRD